MTQDPMQGGTDRNRNTISAVHSLDRQLHEDLHKFLRLYEKSVNAGVGGDIRDAIEKLQTALLNGLSLLEAKIDNLGAGGTPAEVAAITASLRESREKLAAATAPKP